MITNLLIGAIVTFIIAWCLVAINKGKNDE